MAKKKKGGTNHSGSPKFITIILIIIVIALAFGLLWQRYPKFFNDKYTQIRTEVQDTLTENKGNENTQPVNKPEGTTEKQNKPAAKKEKSEGKETDSKASKPSTGSKETASSGSLKQIRKMEIPGRLTDRPDQIVEHLGYTASFNTKWRISNWVAYELTKTETSGESKRNNRFTADPMIKGEQATNADYTRSGYDRGHMAPAADMSWSRKAMDESFYFTNICPQAPELNRGIWKSLEEKGRDWAVRDSAIMIVCGPIVRKNDKTIGINRVVVPSMFYKVILSPFGKKPKAIGFLFENKGSNADLKKLAVPVDSIEKLTGIDFFPKLPDPIESKVERSFNLNDWF